MKNLSVNGRVIQVMEVHEIGNKSVTYKTEDSKGWVVEFYSDGKVAVVVEEKGLKAENLRVGSKVEVCQYDSNTKSNIWVLKTVTKCTKASVWFNDDNYHTTRKTVSNPVDRLGFRIKSI